MAISTVADKGPTHPPSEKSEINGFHPSSYSRINDKSQDGPVRGGMGVMSGTRAL